jgi:hypothetical protein
MKRTPQEVLIHVLQTACYRIGLKTSPEGMSLELTLRSSSQHAPELFPDSSKKRSTRHENLNASQNETGD